MAKQKKRMATMAPPTRYNLEVKGLVNAEQMKALRKDEVSRRQESFLHAYSITGSLKYAEMTAKISRSNHYLWLREDPTYAERFEQARKESVDALESEAHLRAMVGSDQLLMFLLKGNAPHKYKDSMRIDNNTTITHVNKGLDIDSLSLEQCQQILSIMRKPEDLQQLENKIPDVQVVDAEIPPPKKRPIIDLGNL